MLPTTLECLRGQSYPNLDILISVDAADQGSAEACKPFLRKDSRFRMHVHPSRLGWAGNTGWTMKERRGEFYIYQQHDDQVSPSYVADLVDAAQRWPSAAICYSEMRLSGTQNRVVRTPSTLGDPVTRALTHVNRLEASPLRGLIRGAALDSTDGLLVNEFESFGSEHRFMAQLALAGEFRFVGGPTYYKHLHGGNLHLKWYDWTADRRRAAWFALGAWTIKVVVPAGSTVDARLELFRAILKRFLVPGGAFSRLRDRSRTLYKRDSGLLGRAMLAVIDKIRSGGTFDAWLLLPYTRPAFYEIDDPQERVRAAQAIIERLQNGRRFDPSTLELDWQSLKTVAARQFEQ